MAMGGRVVEAMTDGGGRGTALLGGRVLRDRRWRWRETIVRGDRVSQGTCFGDALKATRGIRYGDAVLAWE